jgi:outer membrane protein assembly factor BamB
MMGVYCYDLDGTPLWKKELGSYTTQFGWGSGSSPILHEDHVYIQCDNDEKSFLVALDKHSGNELWRVDRDEQSNWSTPYIWKNKQRTELVLGGGDRIRSYDPKTGHPLWELKAHGRTSITPVGDDQMLYVDSYDRMRGTRGRMEAVRAGGSGDISLKSGETSNEFVAWSVLLNGNRVASPVLLDDGLYVFEQSSAILHCLDTKTGAQRHRQRMQGVVGFIASPLANDGKLFCLDQQGTTLVVKPGDKLEIVATNKLDELCWSSPAVAGDKLLIRSVDHLYCIGK